VLDDPLLRFLVAALACWWLASALYYQKGPWGIWLRLRLWAQNHSPFLQEQLGCFWCCALWAALLVVWPLYIWAPWALVPLALTGAAILLSYGGRVVWREMADQ
jgi:hypothetical protein